MGESKWDLEIIAALGQAGCPLTSGELVKAVLGAPPNKNWVSVQNAVSSAARRGRIKRVANSKGKAWGKKFVYLLNRETQASYGINDRPNWGCK